MQEIKEMKIDITTLSETTNKSKGIEQVGDFIEERIIKANINHWGHKLTLIGTYGPKEDEEVGMKDQYYELLNQIVIEVGNTREVKLIGYLNARVGRRLNHHVVSRFGEDTEYDNGLRLIKLCKQYDLRIMNADFTHKDIQNFTWREITT